MQRMNITLQIEVKEETLTEARVGRRVFKLRVRLYKACAAPVSSANQQSMKKQAHNHLLISPCPTSLQV